MVNIPADTMAPGAGLRADPDSALAGVLEVVRAGADEAERARRITSATLAALRDAGVLRLCVPASVGGMELEPPAVLDVIEILARADGAAGWCAMIAATSGCVAGHLEPARAAEVYGDPDGLVVGPFAPLGTAVPGAGDYQVTGRWPYASMCQDASWLMVGSVDAETKARRLMFVPAREVTVHDTWSALGLCATGSHDVEVSGSVVPAGRSVPLAFDAPVHPGALYRFPVLGLLSAGIAAVALGLARAAIDDLVELACRKTPTYSVRTLAERPATQVAIATQDARWAACRGLLRRRTAEAWAEAERGPVGLDARVALRLAATHAVTEAAQVVTTMYGLGGGTSAYLRSPAQRRLRDVHTATQHAMVAPTLYEIAGRSLLGLRVDPMQV